MDGKGIKVVAKNSKAYHDYFIEDKYEAGIELAGTEVKSIRQGHVNLKDSFCIVKDGQMHVHGMHISPYEKGNIFNKDPLRSRRLLMHKREILRLFAKVKQDGYALVPLSLYFRSQGQVGGGVGQRQEALRQAGLRRGQGRQEGNGPHYEIPPHRRLLMSKRGASPWERKESNGSKSHCHL